MRVGAQFDEQELDSRASTGMVHWEGLSELHNTGTGEHLSLGNRRDDVQRRAAALAATLACV